MSIKASIASFSSPCWSGSDLAPNILPNQFVCVAKSKVNHNRSVAFLTVGVFESRNSSPDLYEKLEKRPFQASCDCPGKLLIRHSVSISQRNALLCRGIDVKVEDGVLPQCRAQQGFVEL